jgi:hypothetical protein
VGEHDGKAFFTCKTDRELRHLMNENNGEGFVVLQINGNDKIKYDLLYKQFPIYTAKKHSITRGDYEGLPCAMKAWDWSDKQMAELADNIASMFGYDSYPEDENEREELESDFWSVMENEAIKMGMTYYEDMTEEEYQADKTAFEAYLKQKAELEKTFYAMCYSIRTYNNMVKEMLKDGKERYLNNGYDEYDEPLSITCVDYNGTGANNYQLDKARYNSDRDCVEFHVVAYNYNKTDEWIASYLLEGSEETYAFDNIMF